MTPFKRMPQEYKAESITEIHRNVLCGKSLLFHNEKLYWRISYASGSSCLIFQIICRLRIPLCFLMGDCDRLSCLWIRTAIAHCQHGTNMPLAAKHKAAELGYASHQLPIPPGEEQTNDEWVPDCNKPFWGPTTLELSNKSCFGEASWRLEDVCRGAGGVCSHIIWTLR